MESYIHITLGLRPKKWPCPEKKKLTNGRMDQMPQSKKRTGFDIQAEESTPALHMPGSRPVRNVVGLGEASVVSWPGDEGRK